MKSKTHSANPVSILFAVLSIAGLTAEASTVWNVNFGKDRITPTDNFVGAASENTQNSTWNNIDSVPQTHLLLADSTASTAAGVTFDIVGSKVGNQGLKTGDKIFTGYIAGAGSTATMNFKGLSMTNSYDLVFYSDWYWQGEAYPVKQTVGTGMSATVYLNRIASRPKGEVPALTEDTNPANVKAGEGNTGNWYRIKGLSPDIKGELAFLIGDGANAPFSGFQLILTASIPPRADFLNLGIPEHPAVISDTDATFTLPYGSDVSKLAPTFRLWPGATSNPKSGTVRNFTSPQTYTVTSSDSRVVKKYTVTAAIAPPLPEFTLTAPAKWDGRKTITVQPKVTNLPLLQTKNGTNFNYQWSVSGLAVTHEASTDTLNLTLSQGSGPMIVTLTMSNGSTGVTKSTSIDVKEPATDPWLERIPAVDEKPVTGQFYARNPSTNLGTIHYNGTQSGSPDTVYLKVYQTPSGGAETLAKTCRQPLVGDAYTLSAPIAAGLITYRVVYGTTTGGVDTDVATVTDLMCGDAYILQGQSNTMATDNSDPRDDGTNPWVRTYGRNKGAWDYARSKGTDPYWEMNIGLWGMALAEQLVKEHSMPICFLNGSIGGTRIDQHLPNGGIYDNLLKRVINAKLTHGIRGIFWHQGESDCSNFGPISDYDYTVYEQSFLTLSTAWKRDYPNVQGYIIHQVMPKPCGMGPKGDQLREVQRQLPRLYSHMSILNTLAIEGYQGCHFSAAGYQNMAKRMAPVVNRDFYGVTYNGPITAPNLKRAYFTSSARTAIALEFDQEIIDSDLSLPNWYVDDVGGLVSSISASGSKVTLQLSSAATETATLDYLQDATWTITEGPATLLYGANGIPALTFADVPIETPHQSQP